MALTVEKPRIRNAGGQYSARGVITAKLLRKAYGGRGRGISSSVLDQAPLTFGDKGLGSLVQFNAPAFEPEKVDTVNAVIRGVSVITSGLIARGHDLEVDDKTLKQMMLCAQEKGQVPVKVDHKSGAGAVCGFLTDFRLDGAKLKADWHLLQSHPQKEQILETAQRMPRGVGLSAAFLSPDKSETTKSGKKAARCHDLLSVDYVTLPAANPDGMFAAKVDTPSSAMTPEQLAAAINDAVTKALAPITEKLDAQAKQLNLISNPPSLEDLANMSDEQLADLGLTVEDVQAALSEVEAGNGAEGELNEDGTAKAAATTEGAVDGKVAAAAPAATGAVGAALSALTKQVTELHARFKSQDEAAELSEVETLFAQVNEKAEALVAENTRLHEALTTGGKAVSAGVEKAVRFSTKTTSKGKFQELVQLGVDEKKLTKAQAFETARKDDPEAFQAYLVEIGAR